MPKDDGGAEAMITSHNGQMFVELSDSFWRNWFAGMALSNSRLLEEASENGPYGFPGSWVKLCYEVADAMLAEGKR